MNRTCNINARRPYCKAVRPRILAIDGKEGARAEDLARRSMAIFDPQGSLRVLA
jgi:hypothetical protein